MLAAVIAAVTAVRRTRRPAPALPDVATPDLAVLSAAVRSRRATAVATALASLPAPRVSPEDEPAMPSLPVVPAPRSPRG